MGTVFFRSCLLWAVFLLVTTLPSCSISSRDDHLEKLQRTRAFLRDKRYYEVLALLQEIDKDIENSPEYYRIQGVSFFKLKDYHRAVVALEKAKPKSLMLQIHLAYLYLLLGDAKKARALADTIEHQYGQTPEVCILKGNISLKEHRYHNAEQYFHLALQSDNFSTKAYIGLGNTYLLHRYFLKAEENYMKALLLSTNETGPYVALTHYYIARRQYDDAEYIINIAINRFPENVNLLMLLSNVYIKIGKGLEALEILKKALKSPLHSDSLKIQIIRLYFHLNRLDEAHHLIHELLEHHGEGYYLLIMLGEYHLRKNNIEQALLNFDRSLMMNDNFYLTNYYLGIIHLMKSHLRLAVKFLEKSVQNYPGFAKAHLLLSCIYMYLKKYSLAAEHANLVLQLDPGNVPAHLVNGIALYMNDFLKEAKYEFEVVEHLDGKHSATHLLQALLALEVGDIDEAKKFSSKLDFHQSEKLFLELETAKFARFDREHIEKRVELFARKPMNYLTLLLMGSYYRERKDLSKAEEYFRNAIAVNNDGVIAYYYLAELEALKGNEAAAIAYLEKAVAANPYFPKAYRALGSLYEKEKDFVKAKLTYEQGLKYAPEDSTLLNNLAWVSLVHLADKPAAYVHIRKARSIAPDDPDIQDTHAWWYYLSADYSQSTALLKKIVEAYPDHPLYRYHLGWAALKSGDNVMAVVNLKKALELGIEDDYKAGILEAIK